MDENKEKTDANIEPVEPVGDKDYVEPFDEHEHLTEQEEDDLIMETAKKIFEKYRRAFEVLAGIDDDDE